MNENGLAVGPAMDGSQQGQGQGQAMLQEVIAALKGGMTPDELLAQGVPPEIIEAAIAQLQAEAQQSQQQQLATPPQPGMM